MDFLRALISCGNLAEAREPDSYENYGSPPSDRHGLIRPVFPNQDTMPKGGFGKVFKKYSQMKLQMKREALTKLNRKASELTTPNNSDTEQRA